MARLSKADAQAILTAGDPAHPQWLEAWESGPETAVEAMACVLLASRLQAERLQRLERELLETRLLAAVAFLVASGAAVALAAQGAAWLGRMLGG